jgi:hypothetical protein
VTAQTKSWRKMLPVHKAANQLPLMDARELRELADDIEQHGLRHKIDLYFDANTGKEYVLDGRNRLDALELLGRDVLDDKGKLLSKYHRQTPTNLGSMPDLVAWVISTNIRRRHLSFAKKRELLATLLKTDAKKSNRQMAKTTGVSHHTVAKVRDGLETTGQIAQLKKTTGADGKDRPAKKPVKPATGGAVPKPKAHAVPATAPAANVTNPHDFDARFLLKEIDALDPAKLADPDAFGEALGVRTTRFISFAAKRKAK